MNRNIKRYQMQAGAETKSGCDSDGRKALRIRPASGNLQVKFAI
jgi:hypothetical protein